MNVPLLDLKTQYARIQPEIMKVMEEICAQQSFILGTHVEQLEETLANFLGTKHAIGVASGSDALLLSLMELGIQPGDEVITVPFTFLLRLVSSRGCMPVQYLSMCAQTRLILIQGN